MTSVEPSQTLGIIYRPPSGKISEFYNELEAIVSGLPRENVHISGDFNIDLLSPECDNFEQLIYEKKLNTQYFLSNP